MILFRGCRLLRDVAAGIAGKQNSDQVLNLWVALYEMRKPLDMSKNGGYIFYLGTVMQRWLTRPFVPFPEELNRLTVTFTVNIFSRHYQRIMLMIWLTCRPTGYFPDITEHPWLKYSCLR